MLGGSSIRLGTIMGIRIGVNVSWFFVLFLFIFVLNSSFEDVLGSSSLAFWTAVAAAFGFFGSILLHELGHAVVARREGIGVSGIDLFFFGGVMKMNSDTRSPGQEFRVAVAGPVVTFAIIVVAAFVSTLLLGWDAFVAAARLRSVATDSAIDLWCSFLVSMNVLLLVFNLVPAFPLDGGRIARAAVWKITGNRNRATKVSGYLGMGFAGLLILYGIWGAHPERRDRRAVGDRPRLPAGLVSARRGRAIRLHRAPAGDHGRRRHGRRAGRDPGRPAGAAGVGRLLPALPRLAVVRHRRG